MQCLHQQAGLSPHIAAVISSCPAVSRTCCLHLQAGLPLHNAAIFVHDEPELPGPLDGGSPALHQASTCLRNICLFCPDVCPMAGSLWSSISVPTVVRLQALGGQAQTARHACCWCSLPARMLAPLHIAPERHAAATPPFHVSLVITTIQSEQTLAQRCFMPPGCLTRLFPSR